MSAHNIRFSSILLCFILISCESSKIDFLIPSSYIGSIIVIYKQNNEGIDNRISTYKIPKSGILFTESKRSSGLMLTNFWYVNSQNEKIDKILSVNEYTGINEDKILISRVIDGQFSINPEVNIDRTYYDNESAKRIKFVYFYVGKKRDLEIGLAKANEKLLEIVESNSFN